MGQAGNALTGQVGWAWVTEVAEEVWNTSASRHYPHFQGGSYCIPVGQVDLAGPSVGAQKVRPMAAGPSHPAGAEQGRAP